MTNKHLLNQITPKDIDQLDQYKLVQLLDHLLKADVFKHNLLVTDHYVPTVKITTPDEGEDGRIIFNGETTSRLPKNRCYFQSKASKLSAQDCVNEVLDKNGELKLKVKEVIENNGCYVIFMSYDVGAKTNIEDREKAIFEKVKEKGLTVKSDQVHVYDSNYIAAWVNEHISAVKLVDSFLRRIRTDSFLTWQQFYEYYHDEIFNDKFHWTSRLEELRDLLFEQLKQHKNTRVIGYSGIGKTKFISECFAPNSGNDKNIFNSAFCYIDISKSNVDEDDIHNFLMNHKDYAGLLVIDNCPDELHDRFSSYIARNCNGMNIITIDNALEADKNPFILLGQNDQSDVCYNILKPVQNLFNENEFKEILDICEGYPYFASVILNHIREVGNETISLELKRQEFKSGIIKKLIAGTKEFPDFENSDLLKVAKGISVFKKLSFIDPEYESVANINKEDYDDKINVVINYVLDSSITLDRFYEIAKRHLNKERKLIERRGLNYSIRPEILAVNLAADWLENYPPHKIDELIEKLTQVGLIEEFCERLKSLDQIERSKLLIENFWGIDRPFVKAEVIKTELGSRLFRSVVEVNPVACVNGLEFTLANFSIKDLNENFGEGRRNIIWALEKLVFREETFDKAALLLAKFSLAENEDFSNNATNQFLQLFHVMLPGTEVSLNRRLAILEELNTNDNTDYKKLVLKAIGSGISFDHFSRIATADKQGTKIFQDYNPSNYGEIFEYWEKLVQIWSEIFDNEKKLRVNALIEIESKINSLANQHRWTDLEEIIKRAESINSEYVWVNGIQALKRLISYEKVIGESRDRVQSLINRLEPKDNFKRLIELRVIEAPFEHKKINIEGKDTYEDIALSNLRKFAVDFINQKQSPENYYGQLLVGRPRFAFPFGKEIGYKLKDEEIFEYLIAGIDFYKNLPTDKRNIEFLGGLIDTLSNEKQKDVINATIGSELYKEALYFTAVTKPDKKDLQKLLTLTEKGLLPVSEYLRFQYGMQLEHLGFETIVWLGNELGKIDKDGYPIALSILYLHTFHNKEFIVKYRDDIKRWITSNNFILIDYPSPQVDDYHWAEMVSLILQETNEKEFASIIMKQLIEATKSPKIHSYNTYVEKVFGLLFKNHFDDVWPIFSKALLDSIGFFNLMLTLKSKNAPKIKYGILFSNLDQNKQDKVYEWCKNNRDKGAKRLAYMMPCIEQIKKNNDEVYYKWHQFALKMIEEFGNDDGFLHEVSANLGGVSWVGSMAVYYTRLIEMFKTLVDHPKRKVREWAKNQISSLERDIKRENMRHEEMYGSKS